MSTARAIFEKSIPESTILRFCQDYLAAEGIFFLRLHCGGAKVKERDIALCPEGTPDLFAQIPQFRPVRWNPEDERACGFPVARSCWIETKRPHGGRLRTFQWAFREMCQYQGALHWVIRTPEEMKRCLPGKMELNRQKLPKAE